MAKLSIRLLESLPQQVFHKSALVDFLHFAALDKPCIRTRIKKIGDFSKVRSWCLENDLLAEIDFEGYVFIARKQPFLKKVISLDQDEKSREFELGKSLGYPSCCCEFIKKIGEMNIDQIAAEILEWKFLGEYGLINPSNYLEGKSLICHLPCSTQCKSSLNIATRALDFVTLNINSAYIEPWKIWLNTL